MVYQYPRWEKMMLKNIATVYGYPTWKKKTMLKNMTTKVTTTRWRRCEEDGIKVFLLTQLRRWHSIRDGEDNDVEEQDDKCDDDDEIKKQVWKEDIEVFLLIQLQSPNSTFISILFLLEKYTKSHTFYGSNI